MFQYFNILRVSVSDIRILKRVNEFCYNISLIEKIRSSGIKILILRAIISRMYFNILDAFQPNKMFFRRNYSDIPVQFCTLNAIVR